MDRLPVTSPFGDAPLYYKPETESTMTDAAELSAAGAPSGTGVVAGFQRSGRGRYATRKWISGPGDGLLFTLMLDHSSLLYRPALTPLLSGLAVARFVEKISGRQCAVKWPNDVLVDGGKIAGILCESRDSRVFIGVGLNCREPEGMPGSASRDAVVFPPVSLSSLGVLHPEPLFIFPEVLRFLRDTFGEQNAVREIENRLYLRGQQVRVVTDPSGRSAAADVRGVLDALGADGQLLLRDAETGGQREIFGGEVFAC